MRNSPTFKIRKHKKAQITVFMIIGIILLFTTALIFYIKDKVVDDMGEGFLSQAEEVPLEIQPVKIFVENCIHETAVDGLKKLGAHGGYIDPTDIELSGTAFITGFEPTNSDAIEIFNGSGLIPYWWYLKSDNSCTNNCLFASNRPPLYKTEDSEKSIEAQLQKYIVKKLPDCLNKFRTFKKQGFLVVPLGEISPNVKVTTKDVSIFTKYPIQLTKGDVQVDVKEYFTRVDLALKDIYDAASEITDSELSLSFLEIHSMNLVSMYSKPLSMNRLPPIGDVDFDNTKFLFWTRSETQKRIENFILPGGMAMLQVFGAKNYFRSIIFDEEGIDPVSTGMLDKTLVSVNETQAPGLKDLTVSFAYLDWWPIYLNINNKELLTPSKIGLPAADLIPLLNLFVVNDYVFYYDVSFPVIATITDDRAFKGKETFKFVFALESNVRNNDIMGSNFSAQYGGYVGTELCNPDFWNTGLITVETYDEIDKTPLPGAKIEFQVGTESCFVGVTELNEENKSTITSKFPVGSGEIRIIAKDHLPVVQKFGALRNQTSNHSFGLLPLFQINSTVKKLLLDYDKVTDKHFLGTNSEVIPLVKKDQAYALFNRIADDEFGEFTSFLKYDPSEDSKPQSLLLAPGKYEVKGYLLKTDGWVINEKTKTFSVPFGEDQKVKLNRTEFDKWQLGGIQYTNETGYLEITKEQLMNNKQVNFIFVSFQPPNNFASDMGAGPYLDTLQMVDDYTIILSDKLKPEWVSD
ncbi:hypothetical protein HN587_03735 [Candidatus Woesearchaeota archaeon]|jgi:hypothetical protein|nr:hypothetical protein [Candidatus Woesearchaeota archaeon]